MSYGTITAALLAGSSLVAQLPGMKAVALALEAAGVVLLVLVWLLLLGLIAFAVYYLVTLPLRRQERARLFVSVLEAGIRQGRSPERTIDSISAAGVRVLGASFWDLANGIEEGLSLGSALASAPGCVPRQISEMLIVGEDVGDIGKVLPACRKALGDASSRVRGATNYLILIVSWFFIINVALVLLFMVFVLPRFYAMFDDMGVALSPVLRFVSRGAPLGVQIAVMVFLFLCIVFYVGGPTLVSVLGLRPLAERIAFRLPWRKRQLQRSFSAMLAVLLDSGVPEPQAVALAARSTGSSVFVRRSAAALAALERGEALAFAMRQFDRTGELEWRLANATHANAGFLRALSGWHESLEAKAFQQEQAAAHLITTAVVVVHGAVAALLAIGVFQSLLAVFKGALLW